MKKILMIVDSKEWAIGHLAKAIIDRNPQYEWKFLEVHPKALERGEINLAPIIEAINWAEIIDFQYWRTCSQLLEMVPELKYKNTILTHQNDKDLLSADWSNVKKIIARTNYAYKILSEKYPDKVELINIGIDLDQFPYWGKDPDKPMVGYVGRIVPWKGLKEVARACFELRYPLLVMGKMDKPSYFAEIPEEHKENMDFRFFDCPDEDRLNAYKEMTIYVGNSGDGRESGTMPYMEAMSVGVPVVTTPSGIAGDVAKHYENALVVPFYDYEALKAGISELMDNPAMREKLRSGAWETVKNLNWDRMAWQYEKIYNSLFFGEEKMVSVIIPATYDRKNHVFDILKSLNDQKYKNIEAVVVWDEENPEGSPEATEWPTINFPVKKVITGKEGYNLAMARNLGAIQASGEFLMFCDSRMCPQPEAVQVFMDFFEENDGKIWAFGEKGGGKQTFVENFSFIRRQDFIDAGMCNERVNEYGGMSQELRERFQSQEFIFPYLKEAKATQLTKSHNKSAEKKGQIIRMKNLLYKLNLY